MKYIFNRNRSDILSVMKSKAEKNNIQVNDNKDKIEIKLTSKETDIPVTFKGTLSENNGNTFLRGKFTYGFYLYTLVIIAAALIIARFIWSVYKNQMNNMALSIGAMILLGVVVFIVFKKSKPTKTLIDNFLNNLSKK